MLAVEKHIRASTTHERAGLEGSPVCLEHVTQGNQGLPPRRAG